jgi:hypothetical protein
MSPYNNDAAVASNFKVAILGCQRSGTTLMREIMNAGETFMLEENWIWSYFQRERWHAGGVWHQPGMDVSPEQMIWDEAVKHFIAKTYEIYFSQKKNDRHTGWGVKAPGVNMARAATYLAGLFPELRFIVMSRDPRDVLTSMRKSPKMMNNLPSDFTVTATNSPDLVEIYFRPYAYWGLVYSALDGLMKSFPDRCHYVRYEEMAADPLAAVTKVCEFLGISFRTELLEPFCRNISNSSVVSMEYEDYLAGRFVTVRSSVGRWKNRLNDDDLMQLTKESGSVAERWGYLIERR